MSNKLEHINSYYSASARYKQAFPALNDDIDTDVAIIGGGFTGVATAIELAERGISVVLLEANRISFGASGRCGGQITGSLSGDKAMEREFGRLMGSEAEKYIWALRWRGHDIIKKRVEKYKIECDLTHGHIQAALYPSHLNELEELLKEAKKFDFDGDIMLLNKEQIREHIESDIYCGGLLNYKNMHVHALDLCVGEALAAQKLGAKIYEKSEVLEIIHAKCPKIITKNGSIRAHKVVLAGNAYHNLESKNIKNYMFSASLPIMATKPLGSEVMDKLIPKRFGVYDCRFVLDYYRPTADNRILFGGGTNYSGNNNSNIEATLKPSLLQTFPRLKEMDVEVEYKWSGIDGIIINRIPQAGVINGNVLYVQGYSGHGIALSHIMGEILATAITGDNKEFEVFENVRHWALPLPKSIGSYAVALGMIYYKLKDKIY